MGSIVRWEEGRSAPAFETRAASTRDLGTKAASAPGGVEAGAAIERIELLRDGTPVQVVEPAAAEWAGALLGVPPAPGSTDVYYVRVTRRDREMAWSSPIWVVGPGGTPPREDRPKSGG